MKITLTSVIVQDQEHALDFYTRVLGFQKKMDLPAGEFRWLTVVSPEDPDGPQLALEPNDNPAAATYQRALYESGIPLTTFAVGDLDQETARLKEAGVKFAVEPTAAGDIRMAVFDDACGNLIQIFEPA